MEGDVVELEECFLDSPLYRERLTKCDNHLQAIEQCLRTALKSARSVIAVTNGGDSGIFGAIFIYSHHHCRARQSI